MMLASKVLRILTVSESEVDTFEILQPLECIGYSIQSERVSTIEEFVSKLELFSWTVILLCPIPVLSFLAMPLSNQKE